MRLSDKYAKRALALVLCLIMLVSMLACALVVSAEEVEELADEGAATYYIYGVASNSPEFGSMNSPTGTFSYDSEKGYYYYDIATFRGDYCFVVSTVANSGSGAVSSQAVTSAASGTGYYLQQGNYHGYSCMHLWNDPGDAIRLYFKTPASGLMAIAQSAVDPTEASTQASTQAATQESTSSGSDPTQSGTTDPSGKEYVYCQNDAGWSQVYAYMWNSTSDNNGAWPGVKMTKLSGDVWRYEVPKKFANIIFNIGSDSTKTGDMVYPGAGSIYNNDDKTWDIYDTSPLQIVYYGSDLDTPQYEGVCITLNASAEGQGTVYYKFSVINGSNTVVLSDYSTKNSAQWTPLSAGTYTLKYEFKDAAGNTNERTKSFSIVSGLTSVSPYIKTVTPNGGEIKKSTPVRLSVSAGGGITGTNLLFYKYTVKDANGNIVNVPYYTLNSNYSFTPSSLGDYTVTVSVQGSNNDTVERTYAYTSVNTLSPTEGTEVPSEPSTQATEPSTEPPTQATEPSTEATSGSTDAPTEASTSAPTEDSTAEATQPSTEAPSYLRGDADDNGMVNILDATYIQRYDLGVPLTINLNLNNADVNRDSYVNIIDATLVQRIELGLSV